jgi:hypothetical protein
MTRRYIPPHIIGKAGEWYVAERRLGRLRYLSGPHRTREAAERSLRGFIA